MANVSADLGSVCFEISTETQIEALKQGLSIPKHQERNITTSVEAELALRLGATLISESGKIMLEARHPKYFVTLPVVTLKSDKAYPVLVFLDRDPKYPGKKTNG